MLQLRYRNSVQDKRIFFMCVVWSRRLFNQFLPLYSREIHLFHKFSTNGRHSKQNGFVIGRMVNNAGWILLSSGIQRLEPAIRRNLSLSIVTKLSRARNQRGADG
jgi:hypothetical protein